MQPGGKTTADIVDVRVQGRTATAVLRGDIDVYTRDLVVSTVSEALAGVDEVVLSLASVTFMDSAGVGGMLALYRAVTAANASLAVSDSTPALQRLFSLSGITELFPVIAAAPDEGARSESVETSTIEAGGTPVERGVVEGPNSL